MVADMSVLTDCPGGVVRVLPFLAHDASELSVITAANWEAR